MIRWLFTIASALSLLLCIASAVMWARSYRVTDMLLVDSPRHRAGVDFSQGAMLLVLNRPQQTHWQFRHKTLPPDDLYDYVFVFMAPDYRGQGALGIYFLAAPFGRGLLLPIWSVALVSAILPVNWILRRRKREQQSGHCKICGYNLTANTSGVCPECGAPAPAVAVQKLF